MKIASVDPGLRGTSVAIWERSKPKLISCRRYTLAASTRLQFVRRCEMIAQFVAREIQTCDLFGIEYPAAMYSAKALAVMGRGDLVKLAFLVGYIASRVGGTMPILLIPVRDWKGQLPKHVIEHHVRRILGRKRTKDLVRDDWDAIGIGLYMILGKDWINGGRV